MKRILSIMFAAVCVIIINSKTVIAQESKSETKTKTEKHIKMLHVDDNGKKTELDTVITGDAPFVWKGDTIGGNKEFKWISHNDFKMDSVHKFDYKIESDGKHNVMIMHSGDGEPMMWEHAMPGVPPVPPVPPVHSMFRMKSHGRNVIDLSDPGIISYDKKVKKDGTEKITIVRKQVDEEMEIDEDVFIHAPGAPAKFEFHTIPDGKTKTVKVIKSDDGTFNVFEDDKVMKVKGHKMKISGTNDPDNSNVEVEVEMDDEGEN